MDLPLRALRRAGVRRVKYEYLIVWKREGMQPARAIRQTLKGALAKVEHLKWIPYPSYDGEPRLPKLERWYIRRREVGPWEDFEL
jgi:hypothetical protein